MANTSTTRTGYIRDSQGYTLLPISHIDLIIGDNGKSIRDIFNTLDENCKTLGITLREEYTALNNTLKEECIAFNNALKEECGVLEKEIDAVDSKLLSVRTIDELQSIEASTLIDGAIAYVVNDKKYYSYNTSENWTLMTTGSDGENDIYSHIWVGPTPPTNVNMIWVDTSSDGIPDNDTDYNTLMNLLNQVAAMQIEIINLRDRIEYLEKNGIVVDPDNPTYPDDPEYPDDPSYDEDDIVLLEDGFELLLEDGTNLLLEIQTEEPIVKDSVLLFENGEEVLLEDGNNLLLER